MGATMSQSLVQIYLHIVFSTKNRQPYLTDRTLREKVYGYMADLQESWLYCSQNWWCWRPCAPSNATLKDTDDFRFYAWTKTFVLGLAENTECGVGIFPLAGWLWRVFSQSIACGRCQEIYHQSGNAPSKGILSGRVPASLQKIWHRNRWALCLGVTVAWLCGTPLGFKGLVALKPRVPRKQAPWALVYNAFGVIDYRHQWFVLHLPTPINIEPQKYV